MHTSPTSPERVVVPPAADIYQAGSLHATLTARTESDGGLVIDLSAIESCDITTIQLLAACRTSAVRAGRSFRAISPSAAFVETCARHGIALSDIGIESTS